MRVRLGAGGAIRLLILCGFIAELALTPASLAGPSRAVAAQQPPTPRPRATTDTATATTTATAALSATATATAALSATATTTSTVTPTTVAPLSGTATATSEATLTGTATVSGMAGLSPTATGLPTATLAVSITPTPAVSPIATATVSDTATPPALPAPTDAAAPPTGTIATLGSGAEVTPTIDAYDRLPLAFEPNQGQTDASVQFLSHGPGFRLYLSGTGATLGVVSRPRAPRGHGVGHGLDRGLGRGLTRADALTGTTPISATSIRLRYDGGDPNARVSGDDALPGVANYLIGSDPSRWQTDVPTYARVSYHDVYPGVDLVYYGTVGRLEYDWRLAAGADPGQIHVAVDGARQVSLDAAGNLVLGTALGPIVQQAPAAYQEDGGRRVPVDVRYILTGADRAGFAVGAYDTSKPLVIDPVLSYSTYLGGGGTDYGNGIAVDGTGAAYVVGSTDSTNFPTTPGVVQTGQGGSTCGTGPCNDAVVAKISADGRSLLYSTYLGGGGNDYGTGIAVDGTGAAYIVGATDSTDFPLVTPFQTTAAGSFVAKLAPRGNALLYSSYLGGSTGATDAEAIAVDAAGSAYVTGYTASTDFPTVNALQGANASTAGLQDAFVSKVNPSGGALVYSTYLGGSNDDIGRSIAVDGSGAAYVAGDTYSTDFPTTAGAAQRTFGGGQYDAFVAKIGASGGALAYSTYLGGSDSESGNGIAVDGAGDAYVVGDTGSTNFPTTPGALQGSLRGPGCGEPLCTNAYAAKLNPGGSALIYSTYLGGTGGAGDGDSASASAVAVDSAGDAYLVGTTSSPDFPTADAVQGRYGGGNSDAFVTALNASGTAPVYSTYLGGSDDDFGDGIAVDASGGAYVTGYTYGSFPTANALQASSGGGSQDAFVAKIRATRSGSIPWHAHGGGMGAVGGGVGLSVDLADGHLDATLSGLSLPGRGPAIAINRTWDSNLAGAGGGGLASSVTPRMGGVLTATVAYTDGAGAVWPFVYTGSPAAAPPYGAYATPAGQPWQLTAATNGYTLTDFLTGEVWRFDGQGRLTSDTDAYGNSDSLSYGSGSATSPSSVVNSGGRAALLAYTNGQLTDVQSPLWASSGGARGQHVTYAYNAGGQLTGLTRGAGTPDAVTTTFGYSGTQLVTITTPYAGATRAWAVAYDAQGRVAGVTSPASGTVGQPGYTPAYTTQYSYSPGQTIVVEGAGTTAALTTTYTLDAAGEATGVTDARGDTTRATYDADHDVTTSTDANGNTTTDKYQYIGPNGSVGQVVEEDQPPIQPYSPQNGVMVSPVITHTYDPATHDLLATGRPEGGVTKYTYDGRHSVVATTEQTTQQTCATSCPVTWRGAINGYDAYGQLTSTTDGRGVAVDATGNATLADPGGLYTSRTSYDAQGDQTSSSTPPIATTLNGITTTAPVTTATTYDADGNATTRTDANGNQTTYTYDHLGRLVATGRPAVRLWDGTIQATTVTTATVDDGAQGAGVDQFSYSGNWGHCANCGPNLYGRSNSWDGTANDAATLAFSGTAVALYAIKDVNNGIAAVSLDGGAETTVDLYAAARTYNVLIWSAGGLAAGRHTLRLRVTGTKNASSSGYLVGPDRADIGVPSAPAGTTTYDAVGNAIGQTDATGAATTSSYDPLGRLVSTTNPVSGTTLLTYTADELTAQQDPIGNVAAYGYDAAGRQVQANNPMTGTVQTAYDAAGNAVAVTTTDRTNGNAAVTIESMGYDSLGRVITDTVVTDTANAAGSALTTLTRYDQDGNVAQTQQPNGDVVYNVYDAADQLTNVEIDPAPLSKQQAATHPAYEAYGYDQAGNQTTFVDADNRITTDQYDGDNRVVQGVAASAAPTGTTTITTTTGYDPDGNVVAETTQTADSTNPGQVQTHTVTSTYNAADWETSSTDDGYTTAYGYDAAGQQRSETIIDGVTPVTMQLDAEGRVTSIGEAYGGAGPYTAQYAYNADDLPTTVSLPGGVSEQATYDANSALTSLAAQGPATGATTTTLATNYAYGYNAAGWTTSSTTISGTDTIAHDASGRLTSDCGPQSIVRNTPDRCYRWTYDKDGNVTSQVDDNGATDVYAYSTTQPNELVHITTLQATVPVTDRYPNPDTYYAYDGNGDTTAITSPVNGAYTDTAAINDHIQYDAQERPITITHLEGGVPITIALAYNADGLRARYTVVMSGTAIDDERFQYRNGQLAQVSAVTATLNGNGTVKGQGLPYIDTFVYGPLGEPLEFLRQQGGATSRYWYALDGQGSVVAVTDSTGKVVDRYNYDSWGEQVGRYPEAVPQQLRYRGYWYDSELEWYWLNGRYYDPESLHFLQPDPSNQDGVHTYAYVGDDPIDILDPSGLDYCFRPAGPFGPLICVPTPHITIPTPHIDPCDVPLFGAVCDRNIAAAMKYYAKTHPPDRRLILVTRIKGQTVAFGVANGRLVPLTIQQARDAALWWHLPVIAAAGLFFHHTGGGGAGAREADVVILYKSPQTPEEVQRLMQHGFRPLPTS